MGAFLEGLKPWLTRELKLKQPRRLPEAMRMAKILEESYHTEKRQSKDGVVGKIAKAPWKSKEVLEDSPHRRKEVHKLSKEEVQDRIKKGLCFKCGDKWSKEHKCKPGQVFVIADTSEEESDEGGKEETEVKKEDGSLSESEEAELSLHAMSGAKTPSTMRLDVDWEARGNLVGGQWVIPQLCEC